MARDASSTQTVLLGDSSLSTNAIGPSLPHVSHAMRQSRAGNKPLVTFVPIPSALDISLPRQVAATRDTPRHKHTTTASSPTRAPAVLYSTAYCSPPPTTASRLTQSPVYHPPRARLRPQGSGLNKNASVIASRKETTPQPTSTTPRPLPTSQSINRLSHTDFRRHAV